VLPRPILLRKAAAKGREKPQASIEERAEKSKPYLQRGGVGGYRHRQNKDSRDPYQKRNITTPSLRKKKGKTKLE